MKPMKNKAKKKSSQQGLGFKIASGLGWALARSLPYLLSLALVGMMLGGVVAYAMNSSTFMLEEVQILNLGTLSQEQAFRFCELRKGENLIAIDLVAVQEVIKRRHPEFKEVQVRRVLPNRIEVALKRRTPMAQIAFSRYVQVDRDFVILPGSSVEPFRNLTILEGAPTPRQGIFVGVQLGDAATRRSLKLSEIIRRSNLLGHRTLTKIDISNVEDFTITIDHATEVHLGKNHFIERLKLLAETLKTLDLDKSKIRSIDLRFDDVVIVPQ